MGVGAPALAGELLHLPHKAAGVGGTSAYPVLEQTNIFTCRSRRQASASRTELATVGKNA